MRLIELRAKIENTEISVPTRFRYIVYARINGSVVSHHRTFAAADKARKRKQPHWKKYSETLYVYRHMPAGWRMLNEDGQDYEYVAYLKRKQLEELGSIEFSPVCQAEQPNLLDTSCFIKPSDVVSSLDFQRMDDYDCSSATSHTHDRGNDPMAVQETVARGWIEQHSEMGWYGEYRGIRCRFFLLHNGNVKKMHLYVPRIGKKAGGPLQLSFSDEAGGTLEKAKQAAEIAINTWHHHSRGLGLNMCSELR
jgi:hypothetical protein